MSLTCGKGNTKERWLVIANASESTTIKKKGYSGTCHDFSCCLHRRIMITLIASLRSHNKLTNEPIQHTLKSKRCFFDYSLCETMSLFRRCCWVPTCPTKLSATSTPSPLLHPCRHWGMWPSRPGPCTTAFLGIKEQKEPNPTSSADTQLNEALGSQCMPLGS